MTQMQQSPGPPTIAVAAVNVGRRLSLADTGGMLILGEVILLLGRTVQSVAIARLLPMDVLGLIGQVILVLGLVAGLAELGQGASISYFLPFIDDNERKNRFVRQCLATVLCGLATGALVIVIFRHAVAASLGSQKLAELLLIAIPLAVAATVRMVLHVALITIHRARIAVMVSVSAGMADVLAILAAAILVHDAGVIITTMACVDTVISVSIILFLLRSFPARRIIDSRKSLWESLSYSTPLWASYMVFLLMPQIDRWVIGTRFDEATFALYTYCARPLPLVGGVAGMLTVILIPRTIELYRGGDVGGIRTLWRNSSRRVWMLAAPLTMWAFIAPEYFLGLLYGSRFEQGGMLLRVYMLLPVIQVIGARGLLRASGRSLAMWVTTVTGLLGSVGLAVVLVNHLGLLGPAIATVIAQAGLTIASILLARPTLGVRLRDAYPLWLMTRITGAAAFACLPLILYKFGPLGSLVHVEHMPPRLLSVISPAFLVPLYPLGLKLMGILSESDINLAKRWLTGRVFRSHADKHPPVAKVDT